MSESNSQEADGDRLERIQSIVQDDYERIQNTDDPFVVLNLSSDAAPEQVRDRYERYERFYRAENFQRLGDMDLTRKALDIRRTIGRAMVEIQSQMEADIDTEHVPAGEDPGPDLPDVDPDAAAMGDIYFRDGLTYLRIGDLETALDYFQRASDYDPSRGIILANLAYTKFKLDPTNDEIVEETGRNLSRAASMEPDNPEIFALLARYGINTRDDDTAERALARLEALDPHHPRLEKLKKRANF